MPNLQIARLDILGMLQAPALNFHWVGLEQIIGFLSLHHIREDKLLAILAESDEALHAVEVASRVTECMIVFVYFDGCVHQPLTDLLDLVAQVYPGLGAEGSVLVNHWVDLIQFTVSLQLILKVLFLKAWILQPELETFLQLALPGDVATFVVVSKEFFHL